jgi:hypothetical protein
MRRISSDLSCPLRKHERIGIATYQNSPNDKKKKEQVTPPLN